MSSNHRARALRGVLQEDAELIGETAAKKVGRGRYLLIHDMIVFLLLCGRLGPCHGRNAVVRVDNTDEEARTRWCREGPSIGG